MCIPSGRARRKQLEKATTIPKKDAQELSESCSERRPEPPRPSLVSLVVTDAQAHGDETYWAVMDPGQTVSVRAVTSPDDATGWALLEWKGASSISADKRTAYVALDSVKNVTVTATLDDVDRKTNIEVYDLVSLDCPLPNGKGYKSEATIRLKATTNPNESKVWKLLTWSEGTPTLGANECDTALKPVGARRVSAKLGTKELRTDVRICQWPTLKILEIKFDSHEVRNDGEADINQPFDMKWVRGRNAPAANQKAAVSQSPLCFTRGTKIRLTATFEVVDRATEDEDVKVQAALGFGSLEGLVKVGAGAAEATLAMTEAAAPLPNAVAADPAWAISWKHLDHDGSTWLDAGSSQHMRYQLLGDPQLPVYLTLLDISCVAANGKSTADDFVAESFKPFTAAKGSGNGFRRRGDDVRMSYYNKGRSTATGNAVQTTEGMLGSAEGTGRCGGWATLLGHMWKMHGVDSSRRWYIRATRQELLNFDLRFLVKNCSFKPAGTRANSGYSHEGELAKKEVEKQDGISGHGQNNPQFDFGDHVVVMYGGKLYDPSYGVGPFDNDDNYLAAALDGLGKWPKIDFVYKGVDQHIPQECVPYAEGFSEYTIVLNPLDFWAKEFGSTGAGIWPYCKFYDSSGHPIVPASLAAVTPGMRVKLATTTGPMWRQMVSLVRLQDIAAKHGKTEDEIFDHPKNARIKALRTRKDQLETGDTIIVPKSLDPHCWLVVGHDLP